MRVIDMHTHIYPDPIAEKATQATANYFPMPEPPHCQGKTGELADLLKRSGIDYAVVFSAATNAHQVESIHRFIANQAEKQPMFIPCGTLHTDYDDYTRELAWLRAHGVHGVKIHPEMQRFAVDDGRLFPMYAELERNDMFLITHEGDPKTDFSGPERTIRVARAFPRLRIIACHLGNWGDWDLEKIRPMAQLPNIYTDISSTFSYVTRREPLFDVLRAYDPTHVFFGSDFPIWEPGDELRKAMALGLPQDFLEDILFHNFARFYYYQQL